MINNKFLHYKTLQGFEDALNTYGSDLDDKIVFIKDKALIWTHGTYYGVVQGAETIIDKKLSDLSTNPVQNKEITININNLYELCRENSSDIEQLTRAFNADVDDTVKRFNDISDFIESISDTSDGAAILAAIQQSIHDEQDRALEAEKSLQARTTNVENSIVNILNKLSEISIPSYSAATSTKNGLMTSQMYNDLYKSVNDIKSLFADIEDINNTIGNIETVIADDGKLQEVINQYNAIVDFLESIDFSGGGEDSSQGEQLLSQIITEIESLKTNLQTLNTSLQNEIDRATRAENLLEDRIQILEDRPSSGGSIGDNIRHIILEQEEYEALDSYEDNAIYFVLEPAKKWTFGGTFPVYFSTASTR